MSIKTAISEAVFNLWCDGKIGEPADELFALKEKTVDQLMDQVKLSQDKRDYLDTEIMNLICQYEKHAFMDGFALGMDVASGAIAQEERSR